MISGGKYATTLRFFADAINKVVPKFDSSTISSLAGYCSSLDKTGWRYDLQDLIFPRTSFKAGGLDKVRPTGIDSYEVILSVKADGKYYLSSQATFDLIQNLELNITVNTFKQNVLQGTFCAWHLDSHPPIGATGDIESPFAHPRYHWQYGGKGVWERAIDNSFYGSHLLLESPRLPHAPLDIVLAVDFVFANFYGEFWKKLLTRDDYKRHIAEAQNHYWYPYFKAICTYWEKPTDSYSYKLMPFLHG